MIKLIAQPPLSLVTRKNYNRLGLKMQGNSFLCYTYFMIKIIAGGKKNKDWLQEACAEYEKRLSKPFDLNWQFVEESELDSKVLALEKDNYVILLDERGKILSSPELSEKMETAFTSGKKIVFVVGGAFGHFSPEMQARADLILSFSKMVFPHQICRLILTEQIYRAQEIYLGHPYHHA